MDVMPKQKNVFNNSFLSPMNKLAYSYGRDAEAQK
jgi:hypothetical protein